MTVTKPYMTPCFLFLDPDITIVTVQIFQEQKHTFNAKNKLNLEKKQDLLYQSGGFFLIDCSLTRQSHSLQFVV